MRKLGPWSLGALAVLVACGQARTLEQTATAGTCTRCHGGTNDATGAPPRDLQGRVDPALPTVGAHTAHVSGAGLAPAFDCTACHPKPAAITSPGHGDGVVTITWSPLASANGELDPVYDRESGCSAVYCHGSFFGGNAANTPIWTQGAPGGACGTCHTIPPPASSGHPQRSGCGDCHGGYTSDSVDLATHVNGAVDLLPLACYACHGDPDRPGTALNPQLAAAPPVDASGNADPSSPGVGAHQAHLQDGPLRGAIACTECHVVPATMQGHPDGVTGLAWGPLATGEETTDPEYAGGSCSATYCHGATLGAGGQNTTPSWTGGAGEVTCGACHGTPPPAPHPQNPACGSCHPGYGAGVNAAVHVNGQVDLAGLTCSSCHGDPDREATPANPHLAAAPPVDTTFSSDPASPGVGAHQAHLQDGDLRTALACTSCHEVPADLRHADGTTDLAWSALATDGGTLSPLYAGGSCSATYCHGATLGGGTNTAPAWTGGAGEVTCGACHSTPPPPETGHTQSVNCGGCHLGYSIASVEPATHVDGQAQFEFSCTSCHGDRNRADTALNPRLSAAPPLDQNGLADPSLPGVGAHQAHLTDSPVRDALACTECHVVPDSLVGHPTGTTDLDWGTLATGGGLTSPAYAGGSCSSTYCHGATLEAGGANTAPAWTGGAAEAACGTCHAAPPPAPHPQTSNCGGCHPGAGVLAADPALHVDGSLDLKPLTCTSCHGDAAEVATPAAPLFAAPPVDTTGSADPSSPGVGAHQAHLQGGALRGALACADCHAVPATNGHANGATDFSWSALATDGGTLAPSYAGGSCASTYCHGASLDAGGANVAPAWTGGAAEVACGACHGTPPPPPHLANDNCGNCHPGFGIAAVDPALHIDGQVTIDLECTSCHGDPARTATPADPRWAAPPLDTSGGEDPARVGAHQRHLGARISSPVACAQCHPVPAGFAGHPTGATDFAWGSIATGGGTTSPSYAGGACSSVYCHGSYSGTYTYYPPYSEEPNTVSYAGNATVPSWTGGALGCNACHGNPPTPAPGVGGVWHSGSHGNFNACQYCHPDASGTGDTAQITNPSLHVNGSIDLTPQFGPTCSCHGF